MMRKPDPAEFVATALPSALGIVAGALGVALVGLWFVIAATPMPS